MELLSALGIESANDIDPNLPLLIGDLRLGSEATAEADRILRGGEFEPNVSIVERAVTTPVYWLVRHPTDGDGEVFAFPRTGDNPDQAQKTLPTALEVAIVRALAALPANQHINIVNGGYQVSIGNPKMLENILSVIGHVGQPLAGDSLLWRNNATIVVKGPQDAFTSTSVECVKNSFVTAPLKFRFLELYRVIEAKFLDRVKNRLLARFRAEPKAALEEALDDVKSEMSQMLSMSEDYKDGFEACWLALDAISTTNRFAIALFRKLKKATLGGGKHKSGAALIYMMRCAIVHAGEKDIIFEGFSDGEAAVELVIPALERIALLLIGFELQ